MGIWGLFFCGMQFFCIHQSAYASEQILNQNGISEPILLSSVKVRDMDATSTADCHSPTVDDSAWETINFAEIMPQQHLCVRAKFDVAKSKLPDNPILFITALAAYKVRINGFWLGSSGIPGGNAQQEIVGGFAGFLRVESQHISPGENLISLELSSFLSPSSFSSIAHSLMLANEDAMLETILWTSIATAVLIGALLMLCLIFTVLYRYFEREPAFFFFSLLCFVTSGLLVFEQIKLWVVYPYDLHLYRLWLITGATTVVAILLPTYYLWQYHLSRKFYWLTTLCSGLFICITTLNSYDNISKWMFILSFSVVLTINIMAFKQQQSLTKSALFINALSLLILVFAPVIFLELGFGFAVCLVLVTIGLSLLRQLSVYRDRALEAGRVKGELLRRNLQPHYLMNCLMQVQELIDFAPKQANAFVGSLADEFRGLVKVSAKDVVTLVDELALCRHHLSIMSIRYQKEYHLLVQYGEDKAFEEDGASFVSIPSAILHSQIENCFTHNRIGGDYPFILVIKKYQDMRCITLKTPLAHTTEKDKVNHNGLGIGETYIRAKLAEVCEPGWQLNSEEKSGYWVTDYQFRLKPEYI